MGQSDLELYRSIIKELAVSSNPKANELSSRLANRLGIPPKQTEEPIASFKDMAYLS